jgi:hypothetical protein
MGAYANENPVFGLDRTMPIVGIGWLLQFLRLRVGKLRQQLLVAEAIKYLRGPIHDKNRPVPPTDDDLLARQHPCKIKVDGTACCNCRSIRIHLADSGTRVAAAPIAPAWMFVLATASVAERHLAAPVLSGDRERTITTARRSDSNLNKQR